MDHVATNFIFQKPVDDSMLPPSQYDRRNATGLRFIEVGFDLPAAATNDYNLPFFTPPVEISFPLSKLDAEFAYDPATTFRIVTVGLESYSVRRIYAEPDATPPVPGFTESTREPIAISCPQLQDQIQTRYLTILPNDQGQGLSGAVSVNLLGKLPGSLTFIAGLVNPLPNDDTIYNFNAPRIAPGVAAPNWASQYVRSLTLRLYVKASYEVNYIPFVGFPHAGKITGARGPVRGTIHPVDQSISAPAESRREADSGVKVVFAEDVNQIVRSAAAEEISAVVVESPQPTTEAAVPKRPRDEEAQGRRVRRRMRAEEEAEEGGMTTEGQPLSDEAVFDPGEDGEGRARSPLSRFKLPRARRRRGETSEDFEERKRFIALQRRTGVSAAESRAAGLS